MTWVQSSEGRVGREECMEVGFRQESVWISSIWGACDKTNLGGGLGVSEASSFVISFIFAPES
jgi:hypothetical protein